MLIALVAFASQVTNIALPAPVDRIYASAYGLLALQRPKKPSDRDVTAHEITRVGDQYKTRTLKCPISTAGFSNLGAPIVYNEEVRLGLGSETVRFSGTATARRSRILKIGRSTVALLDGRLEVLDLIHDDIEFTSYCLGREAEGGFYRARADILDWRGPAEVKRRVLLRADLKPARIGFVWLSLVPSPKGVIAMFECDQLERSGLPNIVLDTSFVRDGGQVERRWLGAADVETGQVRMLASLDVPVLPIGPQYLPSRWRLAYVDSWEAVAVVTDIGVSLVSAR